MVPGCAALSSVSCFKLPLILRGHKRHSKRAAGSSAAAYPKKILTQHTCGQQAMLHGAAESHTPQHKDRTAGWPQQHVHRRRQYRIIRGLQADLQGVAKSPKPRR